MNQTHTKYNTVHTLQASRLDEHSNHFLLTTDHPFKPFDKQHARITMKINGKCLPVLVDSGADCCCVGITTLSRATSKPQLRQLPPNSNVRMQAADKIKTYQVTNYIILPIHCAIKHSSSHERTSSILRFSVPFFVVGKLVLIYTRS